MPTNDIYQYSIIGALMSGICQTGISLPDILKHGNYGLGTVSNLNGEVVVIDGEAYHFPPGKQLRKIDVSDVFPFIMVTHFNPTIARTLPELTMDRLPETLNLLLPCQQNCFLSIRVEGSFNHITFRVIAGQTRPRQQLTELAEDQHVEELDDVEGILFGFWSPAYSGSFSVPGFHLHCLSKDKTQGGHVINFDAREVSLQAAAINKYTVELPQSEDFNHYVIEGGREAELYVAEGAHTRLKSEETW